MTPTPTTPGHGGEIYALARRMRVTPGKLLDWSSNANIFARDITRELVRNAPYPFEHYPDSRAADLVTDIALHEGMEPDQILTGNGASELIWLILSALSPRKVLFLGPIFSEYVRACLALDIAYEILVPPAEIDFLCGPEELEKLWDTDADMVVMCTPNNPAAAVYPNIHNMLNMLRAPRVLIDNSYREFLYGTDGYEANHLRAYSLTARPGVSLFTLHSFTKFFCCPGIRLGYLMGDRVQLARIAALQPSWAVSPFAQSMGRAFLANLDRYRQTLPSMFSALAHMGRELRRLCCMNPKKILEGPNFLCCALARGYRAPKVADALLRQCLIVRDCDSIPGMPPGYIRLQARPEADFCRLLAALENLVPG